MDTELQKIYNQWDYEEKQFRRYKEFELFLFIFQCALLYIYIYSLNYNFLIYYLERDHRMVLVKKNINKNIF